MHACAHSQAGMQQPGTIVATVHHKGLDESFTCNSQALGPSATDNARNACLWQGVKARPPPQN